MGRRGRGPDRPDRARGVPASAVVPVGQHECDEVVDLIADEEAVDHVRAGELVLLGEAPDRRQQDRADMTVHRVHVVVPVERVAGGAVDEGDIGDGVLLRSAPGADTPGCLDEHRSQRACRVLTHPRHPDGECVAQGRLGESASCRVGVERAGGDTGDEVFDCGHRVSIAACTRPRAGRRSGHRYVDVAANSAR